MVRLRGLWDGEAEARFVADEIEALQRRGHTLSEVAILVRTGAQTREFEERFITVGLPYRVIGGPRFYERAEIRDALPTTGSPSSVSSTSPSAASATSP
jgi:DNA helicase-2/ATP-dependent DNA helicase PcrA